MVQVAAQWDSHWVYLHHQLMRLIYCNSLQLAGHISVRSSLSVQFMLAADLSMYTYADYTQLRAKSLHDKHHTLAGIEGSNLILGFITTGMIQGATLHWLKHKAIFRKDRSSILIAGVDTNNFTSKKAVSNLLWFQFQLGP